LSLLATEALCGDRDYIRLREGDTTPLLKWRRREAAEHAWRLLPHLQRSLTGELSIPVIRSL
jgi:hypothetical protein